MRQARDTAVRTAAVDAIAVRVEGNSDTALAALLDLPDQPATLVSDSDARVRVHAMLVLKRRRLLTPDLLEPLQADPDEFVRRRAGQASAGL